MGKNNLFTSVELAKLFGISRSKVLRIEDAGLLEPAGRGGRGNSRLYDAAGIISLAKILNIHDLGYTFADTSEIVLSEGGLDRVVRDLEDQLDQLISAYNAVKIMAGGINPGSARWTYSGPSRCHVKEYCEKFDPYSIPEYIIDTITEAASSGYALDRGHKIFISGIPVDYALAADTDHGFKVNVPILPDTDDEMSVIVPELRDRCLYAYSEDPDITEITGLLENLISDREQFKSGSTFRLDVLSFVYCTFFPGSDKWVYRVHIPGSHRDTFAGKQQI